MVPFEILGAVSYSPSIVTMALFCISSGIEPDIGRKSWFFHTHLHSAPPLGGLRRNIAIQFAAEKLQWWGYPMVKNFGDDMCNRLHIIPACDRHTDGQTSCHGIVHAMHTRRAVKMRKKIYQLSLRGNSGRQLEQRLLTSCCYRAQGTIINFLPRDMCA